MDDRRPLCLVFTGNGWAHAWLSKTTTAYELDRMLVALAEVGMAPEMTRTPWTSPVSDPKPSCATAGR
jgi:hypothetical protein